MSTGNGGHPPQTTDERLRRLETQVETLAGAVRALAEGLERIPSQDVQQDEQAARGARMAHELLLSQGL
ncbi:hypothetical protein ABZ557_18310 [Streptomyces sp. NPDC019645]|uniref:hypothetical protein n=1 Tax=Streptomyces sp. NPDC019645 TaxID=3154786 RepID=UPI0033D77CE4